MEKIKSKDKLTRNVDKISKRSRKDAKKTKLEKILAGVNNGERNLKNVFNYKVQKVTSKRITIPVGLFGNGEHSDSVFKDTQQISEKSKAILNEDLIKIIDLSKKTTIKPRNNEINLLECGGSSKLSDGNPEPYVDLVDSNNKTDVQSSISPNVCNNSASIFREIETKYKRVVLDNESCDKSCKINDELMKSLIEEKYSEAVDVTDYLDEQCGLLVKNYEIPDYQKYLSRKIVKNQTDLNRVSVLNDLREKYKHVRVSNHCVKKQFVKQFNELALKQDLNIELLNMSNIASISLDPEDERQVVPRSPEIASERCKTPVMEVQFSDESYFTPENQRYVYKEPETERYQTCLYMRTEDRPTSNSKNFVDIYVKGEENPGPTLFEINCDNVKPFEFDPKMESKSIVSSKLEHLDSPKSTQPRFTIGSRYNKFDNAKSVYVSANAKKMDIDSKFNVDFKSMSIENFGSEPKRAKTQFTFEVDSQSNYNPSRCYEVQDYKIGSNFEVGRKHPLSESTCNSDSFLSRPRKVCKRSTHLKDRNCIEDVCSSPVFEDREAIVSRRKLNYTSYDHYDQENLDPVPLNTIPESPKSYNDFKGFIKPRFTPEQYRFRKKILANMLEKEKSLSPTEYNLRAQYLPETITSELERKMNKLSESRGLPDFPVLPETPNIEYHPRQF